MLNNLECSSLRVTRRQALKTLAAISAAASTTARSTSALTDDSSMSVTEAARERKLVVAGLVVTRNQFDCEANMRVMEELAAQAAARGAKLLVTPEGFLEGYIIQTKGLTPEKYSSVAQSIPESAYYRRMCDVAARHKVYLAAGFAEIEQNRFYNTCVLLAPDGSLIGKYRKCHTLNDEPLNTRGNNLPVFDTEIGKIGIMICYDRQPPETARLLTLRGADIIVNPAAGSYGEKNTIMMRTRAYENGVPIVFSHFAECLIIDRKGDIVNQYREDSGRAVVAEIEIGRGKSTIDYRRPELYSDLCRSDIKPPRV